MSQFDIYKKAAELKVPARKVWEAMKYKEEHPYDHLQPGDKGFKEIWGKKLKDNEDKINRKKKEDEELYREISEFKKRKGGMDKVHRKYTCL